MAINIYSKIAKETGLDARLVRTVAHHPFEFFSKVMSDPYDHRPVRFRYLGVFFVKPYWHKGLQNVKKIGLPNDGDLIWARIPESKFGRVYINLKQGVVVGRTFISEDYACPISEILFWTKQT
jgi:hypothetical protein